MNPLITFLAGAFLGTIATMLLLSRSDSNNPDAVSSQWIRERIYGPSDLDRGK